MTTLNFGEVLEEMQGSSEGDFLQGLVEHVLIGCGPAIKPVAKDLRQSLRNWGIVAEPMDTGAACRTYNVLLSEDRRVAAALLPVD